MIHCNGNSCSREKDAVIHHRGARIRPYAADNDHNSCYVAKTAYGAVSSKG